MALNLQQFFQQQYPNGLFQQGDPSQQPAQVQAQAPAPAQTTPAPVQTAELPPAQPAQPKSDAQNFFQPPAFAGESDWNTQNPDAYKAYMPARPVNELENVHGLRKALALAFGGMDAFGQGMTGHGGNTLPRWIQEGNAQQLYDQNAGPGGLYQRQGQQQAYQQALGQQKEVAQVNLMQQSVPVTMPNGQTVYVPANSQFAKGMGAAQIGGQAKVQAAQIGARFKTTPQGLVDTQTGATIPNTAAGITITPELAKDYGLSEDWVGRPMKLEQLNQMRSMFAPEVSSSTDSLGLTTSTTHRKVIAGAPAPGGTPAPAAARPMAGGAPAVAPQAAPQGGGAPAAPAQSSAPYGYQPQNATLKAAAAKQPALYSQAAQLAEGDLDPSQVPKRGNANIAISQLANLYSQEKYGKPFSPAQAQIDFNYAHDPQTQNLMKNLQTLTGDGKNPGTLDILRQKAAALGNATLPALNDIKQWASLESGHPQLVGFRTAALDAVDMYAKVMGGGTGTDKGRDMASQLMQKNFSPAQFNEAFSTLQQTLNSRQGAIVGGNRYMAKQYPQQPSGGQQQGTQEPTATGPNGHKIVYRGNKWVDTVTGQPVQ